MNATHTVDWIAVVLWIKNQTARAHLQPAFDWLPGEEEEGGREEEEENQRDGPKANEKQPMFSVCVLAGAPWKIHGCTVVIKVHVIVWQ